MNGNGDGIDAFLVTYFGDGGLAWHMICECSSGRLNHYFWFREEFDFMTDAYYNARFE